MLSVVSKLFLRSVSLVSHSLFFDITNPHSFASLSVTPCSTANKTNELSINQPAPTMRISDLVVLVVALSTKGVASFAPQPIRRQCPSRPTTTTLAERTSEEEYAALQDDDEEGEVPPGQMRVAEIKAELDLRGISYADCFDKESLVERLSEARSTGQANPEILSKFNRQKIEETFKGEKVEINDDEINAAVANDGTLPGGLTPDQFKKLTSNPEVMTLLQNSKMQEAMTLMMTGGREELEQKIKNDPELQETITKLNSIMGSVM